VPSEPSATPTPAPSARAQPSGLPGGDGPLDELTYEQARGALEQVVHRLESGDLPLDDLMALWERGEALAAVCDTRLAGAKARFDEVRKRATPGAEGDASGG
jgi:exodeoxyribonuclease VII small subunit